jgi:hypothetical protein
MLPLFYDSLTDVFVGRREEVMRETPEPSILIEETF